VTATFRIALDRINAMPTPPSFLIHGDISQLSKPEGSTPSSGAQELPDEGCFTFLASMMCRWSGNSTVSGI
jgi:hypothetical protein